MQHVSLLKRIAPDMFKTMERRYQLLRTVCYSQPVGRRSLAIKVKASERFVRRELDLLEEQGLVKVTPGGVEATAAGQQLLIELKDYIRELYDLESLEEAVRGLLGLEKVIVVPGDADSAAVVKKDIARATARYLRSVLKDGDVLAVTGGSTLSEVAAGFPAEGTPKRVTVVPARGGLGEDVTIQSNTVAARMAERLGGQYRLLHAPEQVASSLMDTMMQEPRIRDVISLGRRSRVLLHGIGTAEEMSRRRGMDDAAVMQLIADGAVGEAFGYFFDVSGRITYSMASVGLSLADLERIPLVIAVGGGRSKAWALMAVAAAGYCDVCITDEGAARRLMSIKRLREENKNGC